MRIGGLRRFSIIDYPGKTAAVVFTQGCNFRCPYCFNEELVLPECYKPPIPEENVLDFLRARQGQLEAVVITGGEPTVQKDLPDFARKTRALGYFVKLDTNGSNPAMLRKMITDGLVDYIAMDIKAPLHKYRFLAGVAVDVNKIKESIALIIDSLVPHEFRTTAVKALLPPGDFQSILQLIGRGQPYFIQPFISQESVLDKNLLGKECYTQREIGDLQEQIRQGVDSINCATKGGVLCQLSHQGYMMDCP